MFGQFIKEKRLKLDLSLREFCKKNNLDPSNWSKLEREVSKPPKSDLFLEKVAQYLAIEKNSIDYNRLIDFASIDQGNIPVDMLKNDSIRNFLPVFFRTARETKPTEEELIEILNIIKSANDPE